MKSIEPEAIGRTVSVGLDHKDAVFGSRFMKSGGVSDYFNLIVELPLKGLCAAIHGLRYPSPGETRARVSPSSRSRKWVADIYSYASRCGLRSTSAVATIRNLKWRKGTIKRTLRRREEASGHGLGFTIVSAEEWVNIKPSVV